MGVRTDKVALECLVLHFPLLLLNISSVWTGEPTLLRICLELHEKCMQVFLQSLPPTLNTLSMCSYKQFSENVSRELAWTPYLAKNCFSGMSSSTQNHSIYSKHFQGHLRWTHHVECNWKATERYWAAVQIRSGEGKVIKLCDITCHSCRLLDAFAAVIYISLQNWWIHTWCELWQYTITILLCHSCFSHGRYAITSDTLECVIRWLWWLLKIAGCRLLSKRNIRDRSLCGGRTWGFLRFKDRNNHF